MDSDEYADSCSALVARIEDLPDTCRAADSWLRKIQGMQKTAEERDIVTERMESALVGIEEGVRKWED